MLQHISVIGAGTMGNGIAHHFAQYGFTVRLIDINEEQLAKAVANITKNLDRQVSKNLITGEQKQTALSNITTCTSLAKGVQNAQLVIEAATENEAVKLAIFKEMDEAAPPPCILASQHVFYFHY